MLFTLFLYRELCVECACVDAFECWFGWCVVCMLFGCVCASVCWQVVCVVYWKLLCDVFQQLSAPNVAWTTQTCRLWPCVIWYWCCCCRVVIMHNWDTTDLEQCCVQTHGWKRHIALKSVCCTTGKMASTHNTSYVMHTSIKAQCDEQTTHNESWIMFVHYVNPHNKTSAHALQQTSSPTVHTACPHNIHKLDVTTSRNTCVTGTMMVRTCHIDKLRIMTEEDAYWRFKCVVCVNWWLTVDVC